MASLVGFSYNFDVLFQDRLIMVNESFRSPKSQIFDMRCKNVRQMFFKSQKNILYIVLFCKVKLSKMASIKTKKIKKQTRLFNPIFHDVQLCFWSGRDSSPLKVFKMYFVFVWVCIQNIPDLICNVLIWHLNKDKVHFKDL